MAALNLINGGADAWRNDLVRGRDGGWRADRWNISLIIERHAQWAGAFRYNEFSNCIDVVRPVPWRRSPNAPFDERDAMELACWLGDPRNFEMNADDGLVFRVVDQVSRRSPYNPLVDYLRSVTWDGTPRVDRVLPDFFGSEDTPYTRRVGQMLLVSAVARAMEPGCKVDTMVVFEGSQGTGKTSAMRALFGERFYAASNGTPSDKDFYICLQGTWCFEIEEMQSFSKADTNTVKRAVSSQVDKFREPYARGSKSFPRRCIFTGTTNEDQYLRDPTGARRFLPVRAPSVNVPALRQARDQLWAEAVVMFDRGHNYWTLPESAADEQEARYEADSWEDIIRHWLQRVELTSTEGWPTRLGPGDHPLPTREWLDVVELPDGGFAYQLRWCSSSEVLSHALKIELGRHGRPEQMRVAACMKRLGYRQRQCGPTRQRQWMREPVIPNNLTNPEQPTRTTS